MAITLDKLYRDINSRLANVGVDRQKIVHKDVINSINQAVSVVRQEYIKAGRADEFAETEFKLTLSEDPEYPFLNSATLSNTLLRSLPIELSIRQSLIWKTSNELEDEAQTWSKGDLAIKGSRVYKATEDVSGINTYDNTFKAESVRNYTKDNELKYVKGEVVYDGTSYWEVDADYTNDKGQTASEAGFTKLYWRDKGKAFYEGTYIPFGRFYQTNLFDSIPNHYPFSVRDDTLYAKFDGGPVTFTYIPEWTYVEDLSEELDISDVMERRVRDHALQDLARKLNVQVEFLNNENKDTK